MVARGAGAAGPVLLACRQWDPLGLARRLPSLGVEAWRCAPLLPWREQCPVCVCAALAAGAGGSGRYLVLCLSRFPLPAPRVLRCVWRAVPPGCPLPSLAGTPFHAVCAFRALGPVALLVVPACPFRVCALALPRRPPPPLLGGVAYAPRAVPALGAGRAVPRGPCPSACPAPVPCSVWRAWGGGGPVPVPPYLAWGCGGGGRASPGGGAVYCCEGRLGSGAPPPPTARPLGGLLGSAIHVLWARACGCGGPSLSPRPARPVGAARRGAGPWRSCAGGRAGGGGGGVRCTPRLCGRGGPVGRGVALPRSVPLPSLGRQQSGCHWCRSVHGGRGPPYHSGSCSPAFSGRDLCGVLARWRGLACSPRPLWEPAAGAGGRVALRLLSRAGREPSPLPRGAGAGAPAACGAVGGVGGGSRRGLPAPLLGGGLRYSVLALLMSSAHSLPACACGQGRGAAPGWGGVRGGPWTAPLGAPADLNPPSALPEWAAVTGGSCRSRPPYCSGAPPCAAPKLGARVAPARWCGLALRPRPPREQAAVALGRAVCRSSRTPPPPRVAVTSGGGGRPLGSGGAEGRSCGSQAGQGERGGGGGGGAAPPPPRPVGRRPAICCLRRAPWGILVPWGLPGGRGSRAPSGRPPTGQCGGGGGGEGGGEPPRPGSRPRLPRAGL